MVLPKAKVFFSTPTLRNDDGKANAILQKVSSNLKKSYVNIVENDNIITMGIGKRGLHLNEKGSGRLALNFINLIKRF